MMLKEIRLVLVVLAFTIMLSTINAAITDYYTFAQDTIAYTSIFGITIPSLQVDNALSDVIDIGFSFLFCGHEFTQVKISTNGWIGLGPYHTNYYVTNFINSDIHVNKLAPLWDDLNLQYGIVQYQSSGIAPNRMFTVQYQNACWGYAQTNTANFQVRIYENSKVEFIYGPNQGTITGQGATIGMVGEPGGNTNYFSITPGNPATWSITSENNHVMAYPGNGIRYTFSPPPPPQNDLDALNLTGPSLLSLGVQCHHNIVVRNMGTVTQSNYTVNLMQDNTVLASVPGINLAPSVNAGFNMAWTPAQAGVYYFYGKVVLAGDENTDNDATSLLNITVVDNSPSSINIGIGNQVSVFMPVNFSVYNSWFETIFQASEIGTNGILTGLSFYTQFTQTLQSQRIKVWLGTTAQNGLDAGWIPSTNLIKVFDGVADFPFGTGMANLIFSSPFDYGGGNLVMLVQRPYDINHYTEQNQFRCQTTGTNRSRYRSTNAIAPEPNPTDAATVTGQFPKTTFYYRQVGTNPQMGSVPENHNFGQCIINTPATQTFILLNLGLGNLTVNTVALNGSPFFTLQSVSPLPAILDDTATATVVVRYLPTAEGSHSTTLQVIDNQTRILHNLNIFGSCIDPTIYTVPITQTFDTVEILEMPPGWTIIKQNAPSAVMGLRHSSPHSNPNCFEMDNFYDTAPILMLVSPRIADNLSINTLRVHFWARCTTGTVGIGVMTNPADPATYVELGQKDVAWGTWREHVISLHAYTGIGRFVAIRHIRVSSFNDIYLDDITFEPIPPHDLAALTLSGEPQPVAGVPSIYTVKIFNWGYTTETNYTVKLYRSNGVELASVPGPLICLGDTVQVNISWISTQPGYTTLYAKVFLASDPNPANDQSTFFSVVVMQFGTTLATTGAGDQLAERPFTFWYSYSLFETIYQPDEIGTTGWINAIQFYNSFWDTNYWAHVQLWLGETNQQNLSEGWISSSALQLVFDGTANFPYGNGVVFINFDTPYLYNGDYLVLLAKNVDSGLMLIATWNFFCQTVGTNRSRFAVSYADISTVSPPATANLSGLYPKTTFYISPSIHGSLTGSVTCDGLPVPGAHIVVGDSLYQAVTDSLGQYNMPIVVPGAYQVFCSKTGYYTLALPAYIVNQQTYTLDFDLTPIPLVNLSGHVNADNNPGVGLAGVNLVFSGLANYTVTTDANGDYNLFLLPGIYTIYIVHPGYMLFHLPEYEITETAEQTLDITLIHDTHAWDDVSPVTATLLLRSYPNPFTKNVIIPFQLKSPGKVMLQIYNAKGQKVRTLADACYSAGKKQLVWDGRNDNNQFIASGVYTYVMKTGSYTSTRKLLYIK